MHHHHKGILTLIAVISVLGIGILTNTPSATRLNSQDSTASGALIYFTAEDLELIENEMASICSRGIIPKNQSSMRSCCHERCITSFEFKRQFGCEQRCIMASER